MDDAFESQRGGTLRQSTTLLSIQLAMGSHPHSGGELTIYHLKMKARLVADHERRREQDKVTHIEAVCEKEALSVELTDLYARDNAAAHHTDRFLLVADTPGFPVLRRGLPFYLAVRFCRPFDSTMDIVRFVFELGPRPEVTSGTRHVISVTSKPELAADKTTWDVRVHRQDSCTTIFQVRIPTTCPVGIWRCKIKTSKVETARPDTKMFLISEDIYILFNPWCQEDGVFLDMSEAACQEYILSDSGTLWKGTHRQPRGRYWVFGQYDDVVLPVTMLLLEKSNLDHYKRGNPIEVARAICSVWRSQGEAKMFRLAGDGINPSAYTGSVAILEQYLEEGEVTVSWGHSWVSSAVVVTVCRALGIPCRPVTGYVSGHGSLTLARYFSTDGGLLVPPNGGWSPPWSFHVWVEAWMSRPDLPEGHGGWQVLDPTPLDTSVSACGPTSVEAVRCGEVGLVYDTALVYATVNGELNHWRENLDMDGGFYKIRPNQYCIGCKIITDVLGTDDEKQCHNFEEITKLYKNEEGTARERLAVINAISGFSTPLPPPKMYGGKMREKTKEITFELIEIENVMFGQQFTATVRLQNKGHRDYEVSVTISAYSVLHTGEKAHYIRSRNDTFALQQNQKEALVLSVNPEEYVDKLVDHSLIKIFAFAEVKDSRQRWGEEDDFQMIKPKLMIEVKGSPKVGQEGTVIFSFQNPLTVVLSHCTFCWEGAGHLRPRIQNLRDIMPNELVTISQTFTPKMAGKRKINASFTSRQLTEVVGASTLDVAD